MNYLSLISRILTTTFILCFAGMMMAASSLSAQTPERPSQSPSFWIYGGPNLSTLGPGVTTGVSVRNQSHLYSLRLISTDPKPGEKTWEIAALYGRATSIQNFLFSAGAGVSMVGGKRYSQLFATDEGEELEPMIGFPVEGQIIWNPTRFAGLGLQGFANINTGQPIGGFTLSLRIGRGW